jgi:hypothetical protein
LQFSRLPETCIIQSFLAVKFATILADGEEICIVIQENNEENIFSVP